MPQPFSMILLLILIILPGCMGSHGFDRATMNKALQSNPLIDPTRHSTTPKFSLPLHLGIFFVRHHPAPEAPMKPINWLSRDGDTLRRWLTPLQDDRILADTFVLIDPTIRGDNLDEIKQAGARYGADVLLVVDGASAIDRYDNGYAAFYPTILGAYLAPGTVSHALVIMSGTLWDIRSDWHTPTESVEGQSKNVAPVLRPQDTMTMRDAKDAALEAFGKRLAEQLWILNEELARTQHDSPRIEGEEHAQQEQMLPRSETVHTRSEVIAPEESTTDSR